MINKHRQYSASLKKNHKLHMTGNALCSLAFKNMVRPLHLDTKSCNTTRLLNQPSLVLLQYHLHQSLNFSL